MEAKRPARAARMAAPKSLRDKSSLRPNAAPGSWPMAAKTAAGSVERWQLPPACPWAAAQEDRARSRSEEHTSELQSLMRTSYAVFCLKKKKIKPYKSCHRTTQQH